MIDVVRMKLEMENEMRIAFIYDAVYRVKGGANSKRFKFINTNECKNT